jgi:DNA-binding LytR/AlgR family response regulator
MVRVVILEDEIPARKKLRRFLESLETPVEIVAEIDTVSAGIELLRKQSPDLLFADIELLDGRSFEIFAQVTITCPIIFTTAYDQFWMNAFESNGIDYLLKPFSRERFQQAWDKFLLLRGKPAAEAEAWARIAELVGQQAAPKEYRKRFSVHGRQGIYFLDTENISFFEASEGVVFAYDNSGKRHLMTEATLKEIEEQLDPAAFFRLNRSELVHKAYVESI